MKYAFIFFVAATFALGANQSLNVVGGTTGFPTDNAMGPTQDGRVEFELHAWNYPGTEVSIFDLQGVGIRASAGPGYLRFTMNRAGDAYPGGAPCNLTPVEGTHILVRVQRNHSGGSTGTAECEIFNIDGTNRLAQTLTLTAIGTGLSNNSSIGSASFTGKLGFLRVSSTLVAVNSRPPTTADGGNVSEWKFDGNLNDSSGNSHTLTYSGAAYTNTPDLLVYAKLQTYGHPSWSDWVSMRAGYTNQLDASGSYSMSDISSTPTSYFWQQLSGPNVVRWSSRSVSQPTISNVITGPYRFQVSATDASSTSVATLDVGAVAYNSNGVVIPANPLVSQFFGPLIAFGQNPWAYQDERQLTMLGLQTTYQATANDFGWTTTGQGTISYPFAGRGGYTVPGIAGTTLTSGINSTDTSIAVDDASKLPGLTSLPTWILVGNSSAALEMIRISATTATTGAATLTVAYGGRGLSGNFVAQGGAVNPVIAQTWNSGTTVGEFKIVGTGTLFATDVNRPLCPAGVPGPPGQVVYSTGTVRLAAGSTSIVGTGTTWNSGNGIIPTASGAQAGGFIRISATHDGGTPFVFWAQIVTNANTTHLIVNRQAPVGVDESTDFTYKITGVRYWSLEFAAPTGETARMLWVGMGCETETSAFSVPAHDVVSMNTTVVSGAKYSYKTVINAISAAGTFTPNFYGTGLAARNFYQRSGYSPALTLANFVDDNYIRDPELGDGYTGGVPFTWGGAVIGAWANILFNGSSLLTSANVARFAEIGEAIGSTACNASNTRDDAAALSALTLSANWATESRTAYKSALTTALTRDQNCRRNASDGYVGAEVNSWAASDTWFPPASSTTQPLTLTNGNTAVTGTGFNNGLAGTYPSYAGSTPGYCWGVDVGTVTMTNGQSTFTVASGTLTQQTLIYISNTGVSPVYVGVFEYAVSGSSGQLAGVWQGGNGTFAFMSTGGGALVSGGQVIGGLGSIAAIASLSVSAPDTLANNQALEVPWACKFNSSSSLTLNRPWDGTSTSGLAGGLDYYIAYYNTGAFHQQPFMLGGYKSNQVRFASVNDDTTIANGNVALAPQIGNWFNSYGWDSQNTGHGTLYTSVFKACGTSADIAAGSFYSIHSYQGCGTTGLVAGAAEVGRVNSAEGGSAMIQYYNSQCLIGVAACDAARVVVDIFYGAIVGNKTYCAVPILYSCDGTTASQLDNTSLSAYKWPGFYFGVGGFFTSSWPAVRSGATSPDVRTLLITFSTSSIPAAVNVRCTLFFPSGATEQTTVARTAGVCQFSTADARQGTHTFRLEYLTAGGAVLADTEQMPITVQ